MNKITVVYIINYAPNYRDVFLQELGKYVDLTVISFNGIHVNLKDPEKRMGYNYIELPQKRFLNISFNIDEFKEAGGCYDVIIIGYNLRNPFRLLNLVRRKRVILEGLMYGKNNNFLIKMARRFVINFAEGVLVYSNLVKEKLEKEVSKPIISFNNTSFQKADIEILPLEKNIEKLHILWVGRYQKRKKIERLIHLAEIDDRVKVRLVGPGLRENVESSKDNIQVFEGAYGEELKAHFNWSHVVFNPGGAGLLIMNAGRFGRPIFIDNNSHHGPEIQLAIEANQKFLNFAVEKEVKELVSRCIENPDILQKKGLILAEKLSDRYTVEFMAQQYLKAIEGRWE